MNNRMLHNIKCLIIMPVVLRGKIQLLVGKMSSFGNSKEGSIFRQPILLLYTSL